MIVLRSKFFNKRKAEEKKLDEEDVGTGLVAAGLGSMALSKAGVGKLHEKASDFLNNSRNNSENSKIVKKRLIESAKKQGITFRKTKYNNSAYIPQNKFVRNTLAWMLKHSPHEYRKDALAGINSGLTELEGAGTNLSDLKRGRVILGEGSLADTDVLAHELGHANYMRKNGNGSKIGKIIHKPINRYLGNATIFSRGGKGAFFLNGVHSGYKKEKNKEEGKKTSKFTKYKSIAAPVALSIPVLAAEGYASRHGYRAMKKHGANTETLKLARHRLNAAFGTYVPHSLHSVAAGGSGELVGRGLRKLEKSENNSKKDNREK